MNFFFAQAKLAKAKADYANLERRLAAERSRLEGLLNKALNDLQAAKQAALARSRAGAGAGGPSKSFADVEVQTDAMELPAPGSRRRLRSPAGPKREVLPKSFIKRVMRYIQQVYKDKILADRVDDAKDNQRQTLPEYVMDWFDNRCVSMCLCVCVSVCLCVCLSV